MRINQEAGEKLPAAGRRWFNRNVLPIDHELRFRGAFGAMPKEIRVMATEVLAS